MSVTMAPQAYKDLVEDARRTFPLEACGLLAGRVEGDAKTIERVLPLENVAHSRERFDIDPREQLRAVIKTRKDGLVPLGNYHSHPETPARPSKADLELFLDPEAVYLILSLAERLPVLKAFALAPDGFREEPLVILRDPGPK
jgi:proteasome lid subunit RPN8/RPN11